MAFLSNQIWYCGSSKYASVAAWTALTTYAAGNIVRQLATPTVGVERCFVCLTSTAPVSGASEPTWTTTQGAKTTDGTITWLEITGKPAMNGDVASTNAWPQNTAVSVGVLIKNTVANTFFACTTAGTTNNVIEPTWVTTAGSTTADGTATWTSLGAVGGFAAWGAPWARISLALAASPFAIAGDEVWVSNNHAETQATAISYLSGATGMKLYCVNDGAAPPTALATGGSVTTTGAFGISVGNNATTLYINGLTFNCGTGSSASTLMFGYLGTIYLVNCTLNLPNTSASSIIQQAFGGATNSFISCDTCTFLFAATGQHLQYPEGKCYHTNCTYASSGTVPTTLFTGQGAATGSEFRIRDSDISAIVGTLFAASGNNTIVSAENCKLGAAVTYAGTTSQITTNVKIHNSDSANTNYNYWYSFGLGTAQSETTIVRSGGASDGTTPISWKCISNASASYIAPFLLEEISQWNNLTGGSHTATIELTTNAALTNATFWIVLEYQGNASFPIGSNVSTMATRFATPTALTNSAATWGGGALGHKYSVAATFTAAVVGLIKARIYIASPSITVYVDPLITVS